MENQNFAADVPLSAAQAAHSGTSFVPEKRAESERATYAAQLQADYDALAQLANTPERVAQLAEEFERYRAGYRARFLAKLAARSRCISSMITGPANFPVRRNEKANRSADNRAKELEEFRERALRAIKRELRPDLGPIMASNPAAPDLLGEKIAKAEKAQAMMKAANAAIKKNHKQGQAAQVAALVALGFTEAQALELVRPDRFQGTGFPSYKLTNNSANIRRMKQRAAQVTRARALPEVSAQGSAARLEDCPAENRVRLFFPGKPSEEVRAKLKSRAFRWTPSLGCWQAYRNDWSLHLAAEIAGVPAKGVAEPQTFAERLADASKSTIAPEFAAWLRAVAALNEKTDTEIWYAWRKHDAESAAMDQSATKGEFCRWNKLKDPEEEIGGMEGASICQGCGAPSGERCATGCELADPQEIAGQEKPQ